MTLEKFKSLLETVAITQEEFELSKGIKVPEPSEDSKNESTPDDVQEPIDYDKLDKIIQSRVDKQMAAERKKNAELERRIKNLQKEKLTDEEIKNIEIEEKEKEIAEREKAIVDKENRLFAVKAIKEAGLDDGSDSSLVLVDLVMASEESEITANIKAFKEYFDRKVANEVNKRFKENGYIPNKGTSLNNGANPYTKEQFNLTEQMKLESTNPELALQLKAAAGVKR